jgi:hypothetical protein
MRDHRPIGFPPRAAVGETEARGARRRRGLPEIPHAIAGIDPACVLQHPPARRCLGHAPAAGKFLQFGGIVGQFGFTGVLPLVALLFSQCPAIRVEEAPLVRRAACAERPLHALVHTAGMGQVVEMIEPLDLPPRPEGDRAEHAEKHGQQPGDPRSDLPRRDRFEPRDRGGGFVIVRSRRHVVQPLHQLSASDLLRRRRSRQRTQGEIDEALAGIGHRR